VVKKQLEVIKIFPKSFTVANDKWRTKMATSQQTPSQTPAQSAKSKPLDKSGDMSKKARDMKKEHGSDCGC
jgi:hypothetical protein